MCLISMVTITCVYINTCHKLVHQYTKSIKEDAQKDKIPTWTRVYLSKHTIN